MAIDLPLGWKLGIFMAILIGAYIFLRFNGNDPFIILWEAFSELELNWTAVILTLFFSVILWLVIWKNPLWVNSIAYGFPSKVFLTIATPIVGYPLAVRALNQ